MLGLKLRHYFAGLESFIGSLNVLAVIVLLHSEQHVLFFTITNLLSDNVC